MTQRFFITSTGTDIGKTFFTCALTHQLRTQGHATSAKKPIISGFDASDTSCDTHQLCQAQGLEPNLNNLNKISPIQFKEPLSPDMAATQEGKEISIKNVVEASQLEESADIQLIEGVGGVAVPLNKKENTADWIKALGAPAIIVCGSYLGTLSHTISAYHYLKTQDIPIHCIVVSESAENDIPLTDTQASLQHHVDCPVHIVKRVQKSDAQDDKIWQSAEDITHIINM